MDTIINFRFPHVGEQIFIGLGEDDLIQCLKVSQTWKVLATNVLLQRWKGKIFEACTTGKTEIVKILLQHYNSEESGLNVKGDYGRTPFIVACRNGHKDVVKLLLDNFEGNIDFNARNNLEWTAFMEACYQGHIDVVKLLLDHSEANIDFNARNNFGFTAREAARLLINGHYKHTLMDS